MQKQKGFTLIELIIVVSLIAISVALTGDTLITLVRTFSKSTVKNEIEQSANFVSQKIVKELRNATRVTYLDPGGSSPPGLGPYHEITFVDASNNVINYKVDANVITRSYNGSPAPITESNQPYGVNATCINGNDCFVLLQTDPQVIGINIKMTQAGAASNLIFEGEILIEDTIVIRDTY